MPEVKPVARTSIVRQLRIAAGFTSQVQLARAACVSSTYVAELEHDCLPRRHGTPALGSVCEALGISEQELRRAVDAEEVPR